MPHAIDAGPPCSAGLPDWSIGGRHKGWRAHGRRFGDADERAADRRRHHRLGEAVPSGVFGAIRIVAFAAVTLGAILLALPDRSATQGAATTAGVQTSGAMPTK
jgi:hypothetical protein